MTEVTRKLFVQLLVLSGIYAFSKRPNSNLSVPVLFLEAFLVLYGTVIASNLTAAVFNRISKGSWCFFWTKVQRTSHLIFFSSLLFAYLLIGIREPITFFLTFILIYCFTRMLLRFLVWSRKLFDGSRKGSGVDS